MSGAQTQSILHSQTKALATSVAARISFFELPSTAVSRNALLWREFVFDAELVLMDEPLGALDKQLREHM